MCIRGLVEQRSSRRQRDNMLEAELAMLWKRRASVVMVFGKKLDLEAFSNCDLGVTPSKILFPEGRFLEAVRRLGHKGETGPICF